MYHGDEEGCWDSLLEYMREQDLILDAKLERSTLSCSRMPKQQVRESKPEITGCMRRISGSLSAEDTARLLEASQSALEKCMHHKIFVFRLNWVKFACA